MVSARPELLRADLLRPESLDSAYVQSDRIGGNFAYSSIEGPAYKAVAPVLRSYTRPVTLLQPKIIPQPQQFYYAPSYLNGFSYENVQYI